jgi:hypothetical protein
MHIKNYDFQVQLKNLAKNFSTILVNKKKL